MFCSMSSWEFVSEMCLAHRSCTTWTNTHTHSSHTCLNNLFMDHRALHFLISILFTDHKSSLRLCAAAIHDISHFLFSKICFFLTLFVYTRAHCMHTFSWIEMKYIFSLSSLSCRWFYRLFTLLALHLVRYRTNKIISVHFFLSLFISYHLHAHMCSS